MLPPTRTARTFLCVALFSFIADRITKFIAIHALAAASYAVMPGLSFQLAFNTGISFSLFASSSSWVLTSVVAFIVSLLIIIWRFTAHTCLADWAYGLIIGGAIGNFVDRLYFGGVVDFIDLYYGAWHWPTFNIADTAICIGFILLAWETLHAETSQ